MFDLDNRPTTETAVSRYLQRVKQVFMAKYGMTPAEADLAWRMVLAIFELKLRFPGKRWVLPQQADGFLHELIARTRAYRDFFGVNLRLSGLDPLIIAALETAGRSGRLVEHVYIEAAVTSQGRRRSAEGRETVAAFARTMDVLLSDYGIDCRAVGWDDAGWRSPQYRLVPARYHAFAGFRLSRAQRAALDRIEAVGVATGWTPDLSLFQKRLTRRYDLTADAARLAIISYICFLSAAGSRQGRVILPELTSWMWFEHVIWTEKYRDDCQVKFGEFLDRPALMPVEVPGSTPDWLDRFATAGLMESLSLAGWAVVDPAEV